MLGVVAKFVPEPAYVARSVSAYVVWDLRQVKLLCSSLSLPVLFPTGTSRQRILWRTSGHFGIPPQNYGTWLPTCLHLLRDRWEIQALFRWEVSGAARRTSWMTCLLLFSPSALIARRIANLQCREKLRNGFGRGRRYLPARPPAAQQPHYPRLASNCVRTCRLSSVTSKQS